MTRYFRMSAAAAILVLGGLWLESSNALLRAQTGAAPQQRQLLMINEVNLKPETVHEWAELIKAEAIPAQKKGGVAWRDTWANGPGGEPFLRATVTPISSLADFDNPSPLATALGEKGFADYQAKNRRLLAGSRSTIVTTRPDLGFGTPPAVHKLAIFTVVNVASGRGPDYEAFLQSDVVPALKKAGVTYYAVVQVVWGDDVNKYMSLTAMPDYAEIAKGSPLERSLGPEGMAKLTQKAGPLMTRLERRIIRYLPDLSFRPSAPPSQ